MRFTYECNDCKRVFETDEVIYQCPHCSKEQEENTFPKGNLIVKLNKDDLAKLKEKEHVNMYDFFPFEVPNKDAYPVGGTPLANPIRLAKELGLKNLRCKLDSALLLVLLKIELPQLIAAQSTTL